MGATLIYRSALPIGGKKLLVEHGPTNDSQGRAEDGMLFENAEKSDDTQNDLKSAML